MTHNEFVERALVRSLLREEILKEENRDDPCNYTIDKLKSILNYLSELKSPPQT